MKVDVQKLGCDFYVFSGHKMYGPTGIGILYGKKELLNKMPPYQSGGEMIKSVTFEKTTYKNAPHRFEAGTPNIAGAIGLAEAIQYLKTIGWGNIKRQENQLLNYATRELKKIPGLKIIGQAKVKAPIISFVLKDIHPHDLGTVLDQAVIAIRTGHHCNQPLMQAFNVPATARVSLAFYNTKPEIDKLVRAIKKTQKLFKV
jgi:cysteine desulfurase/selenocysteine lyase